jgi:hypothetical protein
MAVGCTNRDTFQAVSSLIGSGQRAPLQDADRAPERRVGASLRPEHGCQLRPRRETDRIDIHARRISWHSELPRSVWVLPMCASSIGCAMASLGAGFGVVTRSEIVELYAHRADSPSELWLRLFNAAAGQLEMLVYAGFFLPEHSAKLVHTWPRLPAPGGSPAPIRRPRLGRGGALRRGGEHRTCWRTESATSSICTSRCAA